MKLLFDNNLSPKLVIRLANLYPESNHVAVLGLDRASDLEVWKHALQEGYCLVTKDSDFNELLASRGFPPKVIWIRIGNCTTAEIATLLQNYREAILEFAQDDSAGLLELFS
jgi:predicted nuclease of predicted toxin-antitoxin system